MNTSVPRNYASNLTLARNLTHNANAHINTSTPSLALAFPLYLQAAEIYSLLVRQAPEAGGEKKQIKGEWAEVLRLAGEVKKEMKRKEGQGGIVRAEVGRGRCNTSMSNLLS